MCEVVVYGFILNVKLELDLMSLFHFLTEYKTPKMLHRFIIDYNERLPIVKFIADKDNQARTEIPLIHRDMDPCSLW
jgi:hypothetical protein